MANTRVTELDFDTIKQNLKLFLQEQSQFTDYDFDGSNLSVLLDLLSYNTHYNAVLANMISNEMYMDTALKRSSVASLAKHLRYTPNSVRSASAKVKVTLTNIPTNPTYVILEPFTAFNITVDGTELIFYNNEAYTAFPNSSGQYVFEEVVIYEGTALSFNYPILPNPGPDKKYAIPNNNVDTSTLKVKVTYPNGSVETFTRMDDITAANSTSTFYYLEEGTDGKFYIFFGDGILGKNPDAGSVLAIQYLISNGTGGNVSKNITTNWRLNSIAGEEDDYRVVETISKPAGGSDGDTVEQIRFSAINRYSTNGRAVTSKDYASIISSELPGAQSVNVWGGENQTPPSFGKIYISIKPKQGYVLTELEKQRIINEVLKPRSMVTITHEFVDPIYSYLNLTVNVIYNSAMTNVSNSTLVSQVSDKVQTFLDTNLERFNSTFYPSQLQEQIMAIDDAILSANISVEIQKRITIIAGTPFTGTIKFPTKLHPGSLTSNFFIILDAAGSLTKVKMRDFPNDMPPDYNGTGTIRLYNVSNGTIVNDNFGTINYGTGLITIPNLDVYGFVGASSDVRILAEIQENSQDITPGFDEILILDDTVADATSNLKNGLTVNVNMLAKVK
jgi:hypothetical protein